MLYDYEKTDEEYKPWNDQSIISKSTNGKTDDRESANHGTV